MRLVHVNSFGGRGEQPSQFLARSGGIAVGPEGSIYVVGDRELKIFSQTGELIGREKTRRAAWSICAAGETLWVGLQGALEQVDRRGRVLARVADGARLGLITGIAAAGDRLLAADATHRVLRLYDKGQWVRDVGLDVNTRGFMLPNGVLSTAYDAAASRFLVAHPQKHRVERYELDGTPAGHFGKFGNSGLADFGGCCNPNTIAVMADGKVCVSEKAPPRVKIFTPAGEFLAATSDGAFSPESKNMPLAAGGDGRLYAVDSARLTIETFRLVEEA